MTAQIIPFPILARTGSCDRLLHAVPPGRRLDWPTEGEVVEDLLTGRLALCFGPVKLSTGRRLAFVHLQLLAQPDRGLPDQMVSRALSLIRRLPHNRKS